MPDWKTPNGEKLQKGNEMRRWLVELRRSANSEEKKEVRDGSITMDLLESVL
jgi:hypothetical protein